MLRNRSAPRASEVTGLCDWPRPEETARTTRETTRAAARFMGLSGKEFVGKITRGSALPGLPLRINERRSDFLAHFSRLTLGVEQFRRVLRPGDELGEHGRGGGVAHLAQT